MSYQQLQTLSQLRKHVYVYTGVVSDLRVHYFLKSYVTIFVAISPEPYDS